MEKVLRIFDLKTFIAAVIFIASNAFLAFFVERNQFETLILSFSFAFASFYYLYKNIEHTKILFALAVVVKLLFLFAFPVLSNDFYRFIWDGQMSLNGINPFLYIPNQFESINIIPNGQELIEGMGNLNASHYSIYPSTKQIIFYISSFLAQNNLWLNLFFLKIFILLADLGIFYFGKKILTHLKVNNKSIYLVFLNPFVIIETIGNVHFEGVMICFLLMSIYYLFLDKYAISALILAFGIMAKLIPLLYLPLILVFIWKQKQDKLFHWEGKTVKNIGLFSGSLITSLIALAALFYHPELLAHFSKSLNLYFTNFEINASIYYVLRELGFYFVGYNTIGTIGKILPLFVLGGVIILSLFYQKGTKQSLMNNFVYASFLYLLLATTVHPWYILMPLVISIFTSHRFFILWSFTVILSYFPYSQVPFQENYGLIFIEYFLVITLFIYELYHQQKRIDYNGDK